MKQATEHLMLELPTAGGSRYCSVKTLKTGASHFESAQSHSVLQGTRPLNWDTAPVDELKPTRSLFS